MNSPNRGRMIVNMPDTAGTRIPSTWVVMLAGAVGYSLGPLLLSIGAGSVVKDLVRDSGPFSLWGVLVGVQTMLWTLALPPLWLIRRHHWREASNAKAAIWREVLPSAVVLCVLVALFVWVASTNPVPEFLPHLGWKVRGLTIAALFVALVAATSVWVIRARLERLLDARPTKENLAAYTEMRSDLDRLLAYLGAVVGLAVLSSAAMRNVVRDVLPGELDRFHAEAVILYGLVLSLILAAVYLPTLGVARAVGARFRDKLVPFPAPSALVEGLEQRRRLDDVLGLTVSATASFRAAVAILSPLLGGLASLLPKIGAG